MRIFSQDSICLLYTSEHLRRLCRVKQLVFGFPLPFLLVPCLADVPCDVRNLRHHLPVSYTHLQEIMERDNDVTAEKVKNAFLGLERRYHTRMQVFRNHNVNYEKKVERCV